MERDRWKSLLNNLMERGFVCRRVECRLGGFPDVVCSDGKRTFLIELKNTELYGPYTKEQLRAMMSSPEQYVFNRTWPGEHYMAIWSMKEKVWWFVSRNLTLIAQTASPGFFLSAIEMSEWKEVMSKPPKPSNTDHEHLECL